MREQLVRLRLPFWRIAAGAAFAAALAGCAGSGGSTANVTGNEQGGKVPYAEGGIQSAMDAVQAHCRQFGKKGQIIQMTPAAEGGGVIGFRCS